MSVDAPVTQIVPGSAELTGHRYCLRCWYILDGLHSSRCPECGRAFDAADSRTYARQPRRQYQFSRTFPVLLYAALFLVVELICVGFVWVTVGEVASGLYSFALIAGNLIVVASVVFRRRWLTLTLLILLVSLTCPYPVWLRIRLSMLEAEAQRIIGYAEGVRSQTGAYPASLAGYGYRSQWRAAHFTYTAGVSEFRLCWWAENRGVSHWYTPSGGFGYYPD